MNNWSPFLDLKDNSVPADHILGYGGTGLVVLKNDTAVKIPLKWVNTSTQDDVNSNLEVLLREQQVYRRLGTTCEGVVPYVSLTETATHLAWMKNGDLQTYLTQNRVSKPLQLSWFRQMAHALAYIHGRSVLVADIASRNFLLDTDLSVKFCDFNQSSLMSFDTDMENLDEDGYSIHTDIGQLGTVFYEVIVGERPKFDLFQQPDATQATWPLRESLPSTDGLWLGLIIEKCWTKGAFQNAGCLAEALDSVVLDEDEPAQKKKHRAETDSDTMICEHVLLSLYKGGMSLQTVVTFTIVVGSVVYLTTRNWKHR